MKFRPYQVFLLLFALSLLLRWGTFFPSVINHDESTYIVIADEMLRGETYLDQSIDTKPIGLFWLYSAMVFITGGSIFGLRLLATLFVAITAFFLFLAGKRATGSERVGWAAGLIYPFCCSLFTYYGISPNTELFFNAFTAAAIYLAVAPLVGWHGDHPGGWSLKKISFLNFKVAGLLLGAAATIKPVVAAEALAIGLFLLWWGYQHRQFRTAILKACVPLTVGFAIPVAVVFFYYWRLDMLNELVFYNWELTKRYPIELPWYLRLKYLGDYLLRFSPFVIVAGVAWYKRNSLSREWQIFLLLQFVLVTLVVLAPGKRFGHYQIQLHPIVAALAACWWLPHLKRPKWMPKLDFKKSTAIIAGLALLIGLAHFFKYQKKRDQPAEVAAWLNERLGPDDQAFMLNYHQIVYHLIDRPVPTKYVHSSLLFYDHHVQALELDLEEEARKLIDNPNLKYVVARLDEIETDYRDSPITKAMLINFPQVVEFDEELVILSR